MRIRRMRQRAALAASLLACTTPIAAAQTVPRTWDLTGIYRDSAAWANDAAILQRQVSGLPAVARGVRPTASAVAWALERAGEVRRRASRLAVYGEMMADADTRSVSGARMRDSGSTLVRLADAAAAPVEQAIAALPPALLRELPERYAQVRAHRRALATIVRNAPHAVAPDVAPVVASLDAARAAPFELYRAFMNQDLGWRTVRDSRGNETLVNRASIARSSAIPDDSTRRAAVLAYYGRLRELGDAFAKLLEERVERDDAAAHARRYGSGLEAALAREGIHVAARDSLVRVAREAAPLLGRYARVRARLAGATTPTYDRLRVTTPSTRRFSVEESTALIARAFAPLGPDYAHQLERRFQAPWWHLADTPNKRDVVETYYGSVLGGHPTVLMTFRGDAASSAALATATMELMALADVPRMAGPPEHHRPLVWSTALTSAGRILHDRQLRREATTADENRNALIRALEDIRLRFFRNAIYAEFERAIADRVRETGRLHGTEVLALYARILRDYYVSDGHPVDVLPEYDAEWIGNEALFSGPDATRFGIGFAAAAHLVALLDSGNARTTRFFLGALGAGDSELTHDMLRDAGVDLATGAPSRAAVREFERLVGELERVVGAP